MNSYLPSCRIVLGQLFHNIITNLNYYGIRCIGNQLNRKQEKKKDQFIHDIKISAKIMKIIEIQKRDILFAEKYVVNQVKNALIVYN